MEIQDYSSLSYKHQPLTYIIYIAAMVLSLISMVYVVINTPYQEGTGFYFSLPLTFFLCFWYFKDVVPYHHGGYALKVFYFFCLLRYVFLPFFTCYVGHFASRWSANAFTYAIIIQDIELIVSLVTIKHYYARHYRKVSSKVENLRTIDYNDFSLGSLLVIGIATFLIAIRGFSALTAGMRFMVITEALEEESKYGYDRWMAQTMLAFFVVIVTSCFQKKNDKKNSFWNLIIPSIFALLSCTIVFGNNRMMVFYFAFSAISILNVSFPKYKRSISSIMIAAVIVVIVSFTLVKQYGVNLSAGESADVTESGLAGTLSVYVSSTEAIAKVYDMYAITGNQMRFSTIFADIVDKTPIFHLPGLPFLKAVKGITPSYQLAMTGYEVVPTAGQMLYYGGYVFGWLFDILAFWLVISLMVKLEIHSKLEHELGDRYLYTWTSIVCSMVMCYHLGIIYNGFAYIPFFLYVALRINKRIRLSKVS